MSFSSCWVPAILLSSATFFAPYADALVVSDVSNIASQTQLRMPLPVNGVYEIQTLTANDVGKFRDGDGSQWLRIEGKSSNEEDAYTLFIDPSDGQVEMGLAVNSIELSELGVTIDQLREMARARLGKLSYEGKQFSFSAAGRSQFSASVDSEPKKLGYFVFQSDEDANLSLMVLNWGERAEVLVNERIDPSQVSLISPQK